MFLCNDGVNLSFLSARAGQDISQKYIDNAALGAVCQFASMADSMSQILNVWIGIMVHKSDIIGGTNQRRPACQ